MKTLSNQNNVFTPSDTAAAQAKEAKSPLSLEAANTLDESFQPPNFGQLAHVYAISFKRAERLNAANISEDEKSALLSERQDLLDKKFSNTITKQEVNRLEYVRWSLDRIEDALHGEALDLLEEQVSRYERFSKGLTDFTWQLQKQTQSGLKFLKKKK